MADKKADNSSAKNRGKLRGKCGPYNQYLPQPGLKIPRNTLKRWPKIVQESEVLASNNEYTMLSASGSNSYFSSEPSASQSSLYQTDVPFQTDWSETFFDNCEENYFQHSELSDDSDSSNPFDVPADPDLSRLEQARILAEEEEGVKDYLSAFDSAEQMEDENIDGQDEASEDRPLYNGAPITVAVSILLIVTYAVRHCLTGLAIFDLLTLLSLHCTIPNQCASSMKLLKKFFMTLKNPIQFHYYCTFCMEYQGLAIADNKLCKNKSCLKDLSKKDMSSYFIIIPLICQLRDLIQSK